MTAMSCISVSRRSRMLKSDVAHGLTVIPPNRDKLTMRAKPLKTRNLILSLSKEPRF